MIVKITREFGEDSKPEKGEFYQDYYTDTKNKQLS